MANYIVNNMVINGWLQTTMVINQGNQWLIIIVNYGNDG